jgi:hypothetical protein
MDAGDHQNATAPSSGQPALPLVPGRTCGTCNVCCVALTIDDPALQKPQGIRCQHAASDNSCNIYNARPVSCRIFHCGWRHLGWVREPMRPDHSGVLVRLTMIHIANGQPPKASVIFTILEEKGLAAEGFAESIAAAVAGGIPTFFEVPSRPGWSSGVAQVNHLLEPAVRARDKPGLLAILQRCLQLGRAGDSEAVELYGPGMS